MIIQITRTLQQIQAGEYLLLFIAACFLRASESGRARAVAGAAAGDARAVYSDAQ